MKTPRPSSHSRSGPSRWATPQEAGLQRMWQYKRTDRAPAQTLGEVMVEVFKKDIRKRFEKMNKIAPCWQALVPPMLEAHCALENFQRGTLTVLVDSSAHLYELKQLLLSGLEKQLLLACRAAGLRKISLRLGQWDQVQQSQ